MTNMPIVPLISFDDYEVLYGGGIPKHEFIEGHVRAMAGGTRTHSHLILTFGSLLRTAAITAGCVALVERRLDVVRPDGRTDRSYYPDVMVVCEPSVREAAETAPCLVIEVLSESTAAIDQIEKLAAYERLPTVEAYVIVGQAEPRVVVHRRDGDGFRAELYGPGESFPFGVPEHRSRH